MVGTPGFPAREARREKIWGIPGVKSATTLIFAMGCLDCKNKILSICALYLEYIEYRLY